MVARNHIPASLVALMIAWGALSSASARSANLADLAERREWSAVQSLLDRGIPINEAQADGMTALHWAVYHNDLGAAIALLRAGADPSAKNHYGVTPLTIACTNGSGAMVELLLQHGADPNTTLPGGETALMTAARTGVPGPVKLLIAAGADVDAREKDNQTAIMWAAADGHAEAVQLLIDAGADYTTPLESGFSPYYFAVRNGQFDVVKTFLNAGIDVNQAMELEGRINRKRPQDGTSALTLAVENGHFEMAAKLLDLGADPNDARTGFPPLHRLTWVRKPDRGDGDGDPVPEGSGIMTSLQFARDLVKHGADVNFRLEAGQAGRGRLNRYGATPFFLAAARADIAYMELLLELGADPHIPNEDGASAFIVAAGVGCFAPGEVAGTEPEVLEVLPFLLDLGFDINGTDAKGETAMHGAAYKYLPEVARFLDANGADIEVWNQENQHGWTPLSIARGYRFGNFRPIKEMEETITAILVANEVQPTDEVPEVQNNYAN